MVKDNILHKMLFMPMIWVKLVRKFSLRLLHAYTIYLYMYQTLRPYTCMIHIPICSLSVYICTLLPRWAAEASKGGGLIASPSLDDIPIHAPILEAPSTLLGFAPTHSATAVVQGAMLNTGDAAHVKTYYRRWLRMAEGDGVPVAPLLDSHLASVVAMAKPTDVAVKALAPHRTPLHGPGSVEVMALTPSATACSTPSARSLWFSFLVFCISWGLDNGGVTWYA